MSYYFSKTLDCGFDEAIAAPPRRSRPKASAC